MSTIDPSLLESIFSVIYSYAPDPGSTVSYTRARVNINNIHTINCDTLNYSNIEFGDASGNLFVGDRAGCNSSLVSNCTGIGEQSMDYLAKGSNVTGFGFSSLRNTASLTRVVAIGTFAGDSNSNVTDTVLIGDSVARTLSGASSNVIIGSGAGASLTGGSNNILIGAGVNPVVGSNNNVFNIGNTLSGTIGGPIASASHFQVNGTLTAGFLTAQTLGNNATSISLNTSGGQSSGRGQTYAQWLIDSNTTGFGAGRSNQMIAYAYPSLSAPSVRGTVVTAYRVLMSDQAIVGLSTGDVYIDNTLVAGVIVTDNLSVTGTISAINLSVGALIQTSNISVAGTLSATNIYGNIILGVQTV